MGKKKKSSKDQSLKRYRVNPLTGEREEVQGTRSGKGKVHLPLGHPLRTHDLRPQGKKDVKPEKDIKPGDEE